MPDPTEKEKVEDSELRTHVPEQVLRQAEEAEKLHREWMASMEAEVTGKPIEKPVLPDQKVEPVPDEKEEPKVEDKPSVYEELQKSVEAAEHKYKVLQGKYNAEVPEYALRLTQAMNKISVLENDMIALKDRPITDVKRGTDASTIKSEFAEDPNVIYVKDTYPQIWEAFDAVVNKTVEKTTSKFESEIADLRGEVKASKEKTSENEREKFYEGLSSKVKGWETINSSPEWISWLQEKDRYTGKTRQALINDSYGRMDVGTTTNFFTDYIEQSGLTKKESEPVSVQKVVINKKEDIAPSTVNTKIPVVDVDHRDQITTIKSSEVKDYYSYLERVGRMGQPIPEEMKLRGLQIDKAIAEGRIIP
jgi:hypothetical protein